MPKDKVIELKKKRKSKEPIKMPQVVTTEELIDLLPREESDEEIPKAKLHNLIGHINWPGHTHYDDLESIIKALKSVFKFKYKGETNEQIAKDAHNEYYETKISRDEMYERKARYDILINNNITTLNLFGLHAMGWVDLDWNIQDDKVIDKLYKASDLFERFSGRDSEWTFVYGNILDFELGARWKPKKEKEYFLTNGKGTIFFWESGNRDNYRYESWIPPTTFVFGLPSAKKKYQKIMNKLWEVYKTIKQPVLSYETNVQHTSDVFSKSKKRRFRVEIKFTFDDLFLKPYTKYKSAIDLALKFQAALEGIDQGEVVTYKFWTDRND